MPEKNHGTIVIFSTAYLPLLGGAETAIKGITDEIDDFHLVMLTARLRRGSARSEKIGNILVFRLGWGFPFDKVFLPILAFFKFLALRRNLPHPIIFWGMMASYGSIGAWLLKFIYPKIPFVLTVQEGDREWERRKFWWRRILAKTDYVTAISSFLLKEVMKAGYLGSIKVIPNGVNLEKFRNKTPEARKARRIISVSRRVYKNGLDILEKAFVIIRKKFPDAELRIPDGVSYDDVPRELWAADIFARPSRSEGLGTSFLEAMAAGVPIIGTPVGGIPDFLKDNETGLFARVDDPEDLAQKIELLFKDNVLREKLVANGRRLMEEKYQWSKIAQDMNKIFLDLCAS